MAQFKDEKISRILFLEIAGIRINEKDKVKDFNLIFITLLNRIRIKPTKAVQIEFYTIAVLPPISMFVNNWEKQTLVDNFAEAIKVEKDLATISNYLGDEENEALIESNMERVILQL